MKYCTLWFLELVVILSLSGQGKPISPNRPSLRFLPKQYSVLSSEVFL